MHLFRISIMMDNNRHASAHELVFDKMQQTFLYFLLLLVLFVVCAVVSHIAMYDYFYELQKH